MPGAGKITRRRRGYGNRPRFAAWLPALVFAGCTEMPRTYSTRGKDGTEIFRDDFSQQELGPTWRATGAGAAITQGMLSLENLRNHPLWLDVPLPDNVRITFDAWALTEDGDVKVELFGDGHSYATAPNYVASGYVVLFGGWNNTLSAIVRRNEHGRDRVTTSEPKVEADRAYHFEITRSGGELRWEIDGKEMLVLDDPTPLRGPGHDRFAFSGWEAPTQFDNLVIEAL